MSEEKRLEFNKVIKGSLYRKVDPRRRSELKTIQPGQIGQWLKDIHEASSAKPSNQPKETQSEQVEYEKAFGLNVISESESDESEHDIYEHGSNSNHSPSVFKEDDEQGTERRNKQTQNNKLHSEARKKEQELKHKSTFRNIKSMDPDMLRTEHGHQTTNEHLRIETPLATLDDNMNKQPPSSPGMIDSGRLQ